MKKRKNRNLVLVISVLVGIIIVGVIVGINVNKKISGEVVVGEKIGEEEKVEYSYEESKILNEQRHKLPEYVPGEILIKFKSDIGIKQIKKLGKIQITTNKPSINSLNTKYKIKTAEKVFKINEKKLKKSEENLINIYKLKTSSKENLLKIIEEYKKDPNVEYAEPNYLAYTSFVPNDPLYSQQWAHQNTQAELGWDIERGNENIVIAIIDTGVDYNHEDLAENIWINKDETLKPIDYDHNGYVADVRGYDFVDTFSTACHSSEDCSNPDNNPSDFHGHGTHVAGIAAAVSNNNKGVAGVCHNCKIMDVRAGWATTQGGGALEYDDIANAIKYAADNNASIISMSFGGPDSETLKNAIDYAYNKGVVLVAAAGNDYANWKNYPAAYDNVIAVTATDSQNRKAQFSNYGFWTDIASPGVDILSTVPTIGTLSDPSGYRTLQGTSMATPYVSGLAGLILSKNPNWNNEQVKRILQQGVDIPNVDMPDSDYYIGTGRVNVYKALQINSLSDAVAEITYPENGEVISDNIDIIGRAIGTSYILEYGEGIYPTEWFTEGVTLVNNGNIPIENGLLGTIDSYYLFEGLNTIKLTVTDQNNIITEDKIVLLVDSVKINSPFSNDIYKLGIILKINGSVILKLGDNYIVEYGQGENPTQWFTDGITLTNGGTSSIKEGILATWDTSNLETNFYTIKWTINKRGILEYKYIKYIYLDSTLKEGWPVYVEWDYEEESFFKTSSDLFITLSKFNSKTSNNSQVILNRKKEFSLNEKTGFFQAGHLAPVVEDIDNDNFKEIIIFKGGNPPKLKVYRHDGSLFWQVEVGTSSASWNLPIPIIDDLNNDGFKEIIASNPLFSSALELYVFNYQGNVLEQYNPIYILPDFHPTIITADLDLDGNKEIIVEGHDIYGNESVSIIKEGRIINSCQKGDTTPGSDLYSSSAVGNFDNDPQLEIITTVSSEHYDYESNDWVSDGMIYIYNLDGTLVNGWPIYMPGWIFSSPAVGDINNDSYEEIIVGLMYSSRIFPNDKQGGVYVFDRNGDILPGWPVEKGWKFWSSPSLADFNQDGYLEIAASRLGFETYIFNYKGEILNGWPQYTTWNDYYSTIVGDINNDNIPDLLTTAGLGFKPSIEYHGGVYAWNFDGSSIDGFPKVTESDAQSPAVIADIDNDGKLELIASSDLDWDWQTGRYKERGSIYVWDIESPYNPSTMHWPTFHHDVQRTGLYSPPPTPTPTPAEV